MKKLSKKILTLVGMSMMLVGCGGNTSSTTDTSAKGNSSVTESAEVKLSRIIISIKPTKTTYAVGEKFDPTGMVIVGYYSNGTREEVKDYTYDKTGELTLEDTEVTITYQGVSTKLKITVRGYDMEVKEAGTTRIEAEDLDLSTMEDDGNGAIESDSRSSGGHSLGHIVSGYLSVKFTTNDTYNLTVGANLAKYEAEKVSTYVTFSIDDKTATFDDITLGRMEDGSNDWFNWKVSNVDCGSLTPGIHTFKINFIIGLNLDCFDFTFSK